MLLSDYIDVVYGTARGNRASFLKENPDILPQELSRWLKAGLKMAKFAQRAKNVKLALNSKITHLNSRSQSALASNILVQHIEQPMHRYLFLRLMD